MDGLTEGRIVHYVLGNSTRSAGEHRPAIVVKVWRRGDGSSPENGVCNLQVITDAGNDGLESVMWKTSILYSEEPEPNTWHWIEKA